MPYAVVDDLLVDDARAIVTRAMTTRGFLRARVNTRVQTDGDTRVLAVEVQEGEAWFQVAHNQIGRASCRERV